MDIKVLGSGCRKCELLFREAEKAIAQSGQRASLTKVEQVAEIAAHGVMVSPALVIDGRVVSAGRIPGAAEITAMIHTARTETGS